MTQLSKAPDGAFSMAMVAGETSGDLLAGLMMQGIRAQWPEANLYGIGGPRMQAQGFNALWPSDKLAVRGYVEVLRHYREIVGIRNQLKAQLLAKPPQVFVGVDAPDFNLDLEHDLKQAGIPTVHFVCPSIWAWRAERIEKIKQSVDHVLCIFPFETELLHAHGIPATYVGHPLAQAIPMHVDTLKARQELKLEADRPVVALLPGSRIRNYLFGRTVFENSHVAKSATTEIAIRVARHACHAIAHRTHSRQGGRHTCSNFEGAIACGIGGLRCHTHCQWHSHTRSGTV